MSAGRIERPAHDTAYKRDHLAKVDKAFLPKLGNETKAHRPIDVRDHLAGDLLDGLLCQFRAELYADILEDIGRCAATHADVAQGPNLIVSQILPAQMGVTCLPFFGPTDA